MPGPGGAVSPRRDLAIVLGVPPEQCRMVMHDIGGNFGTRGGFNPEFAIVAWAARRVGRPVKWTGDRSEYFQADHQARDLAVSAEAGARRRRHLPRDARLEPGQPGRLRARLRLPQQGVEIMSSIYHVPAVHFRARAALTNTAPTRPYRSSGRPRGHVRSWSASSTWPRARTGIDRIELRRRNLVPEAAMPYTNPFGMVYDSGHYHEVMERRALACRLAGLPCPPRGGERAWQMPRHRHRQLRRHRDRRAAREGRSHGIAGRCGGSGRRHGVAGPGARNQLCPADH